MFNIAVLQGWRLRTQALGRPPAVLTTGAVKHPLKVLPPSASHQERFGLESMHWLGCSGRCKGLAQQVADLKTVAAAPHNSRRWRAPEIIVFFPSGADEGVVAALRDMGITVAVGPGELVCDLLHLVLFWRKESKSSRLTALHALTGFDYQYATTQLWASVLQGESTALALALLSSACCCQNPALAAYDLNLSSRT